MNKPTNGNSQHHNSIIIEIKKTQNGYKFENQYNQIRKFDHNIDTNLQNQNGYEVPLNWTPQDINFTVRINQSEYQQKLKEDYIGINQEVLKEYQQIKKCLPFYSRWFNFYQISHIEKESLPEFFLDKPSKTPQIFIRIRNFIVQCYWKDPKSYLTATSCRRCICGDVSSILRIHAFLEHWGIINSSYNPSSFDISNVLKQNFYFPVFKKSYGQKQKFKSFSSKVMHDQIKISLFEELNVQRPICFSCDQKVDEDWFEQKQLKIPIKDLDIVNLCRQCFIEEKLPIMLAPQDFIHVTIFQKSKKKQQNKFCFSVNDKIKLLQGLKEIDGNIEQLDKLQEQFPQVQKSDILLQILKLGLQKKESLGELEAYGIYHNEFSYLQTTQKKFQQKLIQFTQLLNNDQDKIINERIIKLQQDKKQCSQFNNRLRKFHQNVMKKKLEKKLEYFRIKEKLMRTHQKFLIQKQKEF